MERRLDGEMLVIADKDRAQAVAGVMGGASAMGFIAGPLIGYMYEWSPFIPYVFMGVLMVALFVRRVYLQRWAPRWAQPGYWLRRRS